MIILNIAEWIVSFLIISLSSLIAGCAVLLWSVIFSITVEWFARTFKKGENK